jgi:alkylation response protein AidB-like acyl-CoA dehydrogenase
MPLSDAEEALIAQAATLAHTRITPLAPTWERERRIGREVLAEAVALGLTRLQLPASHGGLDFSFQCKARVAEVLAAGDFGFCMSWINTHNVAALLARKARPAVAARYVDDLVAGRRLGCTALTEPGAGSDFAAITTTATRRRAVARIDGAKAWITNAAEADVVVLYAQTEPGSGGRGIAGFVVDGRRAGFIRQPGYALGGQHTIGTGGFTAGGLHRQRRRTAAPAGPGLQGRAGLDQRRAHLHRRHVLRHGR